MFDAIWPSGAFLWFSKLVWPLQLVHSLSCVVYENNINMQTYLITHFYQALILFNCSKVCFVCMIFSGRMWNCSNFNLSNEQNRYEQANLNVLSFTVKSCTFTSYITVILSNINNTSKIHMFVIFNFKKNLARLFKDRLHII